MGAKRSKEGGDASRTTIAHTALRNNDQREALSTISVQERLEAMNSLQDLPLWKNVPFLHPGSIERQAQRKNTESTGAAECTSKEQATPEANQNFSPAPLVEENLSRGEGSQTLTQKCAELDILIKRLQHPFSGMSKMPVDPRALRWQGILSPYPRILILGAQGTGKSCLGFWLLEILRNRGPCFVYRFPEAGRGLLPPWMGILQELCDAPPGSIILIDEAYLVFFSRDPQSAPNREISRIMNLARQNRFSFIFVAHESRHLEMNILSGIDTLVLKRPGPLQLELDRRFLRPYLKKAHEAFEGKNASLGKVLSYICFSASGFSGTLENSKASFWSEELSHVYALGKLGGEARPAQKLSKKEKKERAKGLHDDYGYSYGQIARELGIGKTTAHRWVNEKPQSGTEGKVNGKMSLNSNKGTFHSFHLPFFGTQMERL